MRGRGKQGRGSGRRALAALVVLVVALACTGCVGAMPLSDFDAEMATRSGGISPQLTTRALAALEERLGVRTLELHELRVDGRTRVVTVEVRDPRQPTHLDAYRFFDRTLDGPDPISLDRGFSFELETFRSGDVPALAHVDRLVRRTLRELAIDDARVETLVVTRDDDGVRIRLAARSDRAAGEAEFAGDGTLISAGRS